MAFLCAERDVFMYSKL